MPKFFACALFALLIGGGLTTTLVAQPGDLADPFGDPIPGVPQPEEDPFEVEPAPPRVERAQPQPTAPSETPVMPLAVSGTKAAFEALDERVELKFVETPLRDVADYLERVTQAHVHLDTRALEEYGIAPDTPVTFSASGLKLRSGLRLMLRQLDLTYAVRDGGLQITTNDAAEQTLATKVYPVARLITSRVSRSGLHGDLHGADGWTLSDLNDVVEAVVQSTKWDSVGGPASCEGFRQSLVVTATPSMHEEVAALLAALEAGIVAAEKSPADPPPASYYPQLNPKSDDGKILAGLEKQIDVDVIETPLDDVMQDIAKRAGIAIQLDYRAMEEVGIGGDTPVTRLLRGIRLQSTLRLMLREMDLTFVVRDGVLLVTTPEEAEGDLIVRVLPVSDLVPSASDGERLEQLTPFSDHDALIKLIVATIRPTTWEYVGGPGAIEAYRGCLVLAQTEEVLNDINSLIAGLRKMQAEVKTAKKDGKPLPTEAIEVGDCCGAAHAKLRAKLEADVGMHQIADLPLQDFVDLLKEHCGVEMQIDHRALEEVGIGTDTPLTAKLGGESLGDALHRVLRELDLTWVILHDVILITTPEEHESHPVTRIYSVGDLVQSDEALLDPPVDFEELIEVLLQSVQPTSWEQVGGIGVIEPFAPTPALVISQSAEVHERIAVLLADLRANQAKVDVAAAPLVDKAEEVIKNKAGERLHVKIYRLAFTKPEDVQEIAATIADLVEPESWKSGEPYVLRAVTGSIVVRHTARAHRAIDALVRELDSPTSSAPAPADGKMQGLGGGVLHIPVE